MEDFCDYLRPSIDKIHPAVIGGQVTALGLRFGLMQKQEIPFFIIYDLT